VSDFLTNPTGKTAGLELHAAVMLFGAAGLFGKLLDTSPTLIAAARSGVAALALLILLKAYNVSATLPVGGFRLKIGIVGILLAAHWTTFFYSIQLSTVAIGLVGIATYPIFVAALEPLLARRAYEMIDIVSVGLVAVGLIVIAPSVSWSNMTDTAIFWSTFSGLLFAIVTLINRTLVKDVDFRSLAFWQHGVACAALLPVLFVSGDRLAIDVWTGGLLVALGLFFTALPHTLFLKSLTELRATYASLVTGLEPIYGITLAAVLLNEYPDLRTILGVIIVVATVAYYSWSKARDHKSSSNAEA
jgi:drug/metabolite transporter (DMT)-like permease